MDASNSHNGKMKIEQVPDIADECWQAMKDVTKAKTFAVCMELSEDESLVRVEKAFDWEESGSWTTMEEHLGAIDQHPRWLVVNLPYLTMSKGKRNKVVFITWVPDTITRSSMRESVRIKFNGVSHGGPLRKQAAVDGVTMYQANDKDDITLWSVFDKVSKFERDEVDKNTLSCLVRAT